MKKIYDVHFTLAEEAVIAIEAINEEGAEEKFNEMTAAELFERIKNAIEYGGFEITEIEEVDECD